MSSDISTEDQIVVRANYELFVVGLLIIQVFNSILIVSLRDAQTERIPVIVGFLVSLYLMADVLYRLFHRAPDRRRFLFTYHGYLPLIGSLPIPFASVFGLAWYWQVTTKLRRPDFREGGSVVVQKRAQSTLLVVILAAIIVLELSSMLIIRVEETDPNALIVTANDALWWSIVTMATVGYGDMYPVTVAGRLVAVFAIVIGFTLFSVLTSFMAQSFMQPSGSVVRKHLADETSASETSAGAATSIDSIKQFLDQQESAQKQSFDELRSRLTELESRLENAEGETQDRK